MADLIDRQTAIDAVDNYIGTFDAIDVNFLDGLKTAKKLMMQLPSAQPEPIKVSVDHAMTEEELKELKQKIADSPVILLPSAQPEIIRCKDCKYWHREIHNGIEYFNFSSCDLYHYGDGHNFYCADAKRRTDE